MKEFEAILFDFDGVLVDSEPVHCDCWREALAPLGIDVTWDVYAAHCIGAAESAMMPVFARLANPPADPATLWQRYALKKKLFQERMTQHPPFAEGIVEFFRDLSQDYKLAVVSSSGHLEIDPLLESVGIMPYLSTIVGGGDVKKHKPHPEPYILAGQNLGIRRALAVEDSPPGMQSARDAGFDVIRIEHPSRMMEMVRARLNGAH